MKIYTKQGDGGQTGLFGGRRVSKDHLRIETYGTVDELNSVLGVCIVGCGHESMRSLLIRLQHQLLVLGADLASPPDVRQVGRIERIGEAHVHFLEKQIDAVSDKLPPLKKFVLPGGSLTAANLHLARTVCRRAERRLVSLMAESVGESGPWALVYLNRLSDLLFTLARQANQLDGLGDVEWEGGTGL